MLEVIFLAILQGIAEFLPISSSGHLVISQHLLGVAAEGMRLDICLHVGTLISIFAFYRKNISAIFFDCFSFSSSSADRKSAWLFVAKLLCSSLPAVIVYFVFKHQIECLFENTKMVGAFLMFTGAVLVGTRYLPRGTKGVSFWRAFLMGAGQALALLPGVSRSGMTLACARGGKVAPEKAAEFSFLMSSPLIIGALILEIVKSFKQSAAVEAEQVSWSLLLIGMAVSAIVGYYSLKLLVKALKGKWFWLFGPYCFFAGLITFLFIK